MCMNVWTFSYQHIKRIRSNLFRNTNKLFWNYITASNGIFAIIFLFFHNLSHWHVEKCCCPIYPTTVLLLELPVVRFGIREIEMRNIKENCQKKSDDRDEFGQMIDCMYVRYRVHKNVCLCVKVNIEKFCWHIPCGVEIYREILLKWLIVGNGKKPQKVHTKFHQMLSQNEINFRTIRYLSMQLVWDSCLQWFADYMS